MSSGLSSLLAAAARARVKVQYRNPEQMAKDEARLKWLPKVGKVTPRRFPSDGPRHNPRRHAPDPRLSPNYLRDRRLSTRSSRRRAQRAADLGPYVVASKYTGTR